MSTDPSLPPPLPPAVLPYAVPVAYQPSAPVWREDNVLVAVIGAALPCNCVKCDAPVEPSRAIRKDYYWHHPLLILLIFAGVLVYAIVAIVVRKKGTVTFCLCEKHRANRRNAIILGWLLIPGGIATLIAGAVNSSAVIAILGGVMFIGGIVAAVMAQPLKPKRIDDRHMWFKGVCQPFLAELPGTVRQ